MEITAFPNFFRCMSWLLLAGFVAACGGSQTAPLEEGDSQVATQISIFSSKSNQKQWVLQADAADFENLQRATLKNPRLTLQEDGKDSAFVSGDIGTFNYEKQLVSIEGNAHLESLTEQAVLTAPEFFYDIKKDRIWSDTRTVITRGSAKSIAKNGIETNAKLTKIVLKKHTTRLPVSAQEFKRKTP